MTDGYKVRISQQAIDTMRGLDQVLRDSYAEALQRQLTTPFPYALVPHVAPTRRQKLRRWVRRHTPHVYLGEHVCDCEDW